MNRGQFSMEVILLVAFLFILLLSSVYYKIYIDFSNSALKEEYLKAKSCSELSELISRAFISGKGTIIDYTLDYNALVYKEDELCIDTLCCYYTGDISSNISLSKGNIKIKYWDSLVIENES